MLHAPRARIAAYDAARVFANAVAQEASLCRPAPTLFPSSSSNSSDKNGGFDTSDDEELFTLRPVPGKLSTLLDIISRSETRQVGGGGGGGRQVDKALTRDEQLADAHALELELILLTSVITAGGLGDPEPY